MLVGVPEKLKLTGGVVVELLLEQKLPALRLILFPDCPLKVQLFLLELLDSRSQPRLQVDDLELHLLSDFDVVDFLPFQDVVLLLQPGNLVAEAVLVSLSVVHLVSHLEKTVL